MSIKKLFSRSQLFTRGSVPASFWCGGKLSWKTVILVIIIAVGVLLRVYNFDNWLIMKGDQVRDAILIERAYEKGPGELPLLGPRAGGSLLRLGPVFYYFQYLSAVIFKEASPPVLVYPNLIFSILAVAIFYFLSRKYFSQNISLALTAIFSVCFLAVEYSRFAWNPNSLPFFIMLSFYSLLSIMDEDEKRKWLWVVIFSLAFSVSTQLHFMAFLALPIFLGIFSILRFRYCKKNITWKMLATFVLIVFVFYLPVIINDVIYKGDNLKHFLSSVESKSSSKALIQKIYIDAYYCGKYFLRIITGYMGPEKILHWLAVPLIALGLLLNIRKIFKKDIDHKRRNFLVAIATWFIVNFMLFIPLADKIDKPRFFLPIIFVPIFFLGFFISYIYSKSWKLAQKITITLVVICFILNAFFTLTWLYELEKSQKEIVIPKENLILKYKKDSAWWTWGHFEKVAEYIKDDCKKKEIYYYIPKQVLEFSDSIEFALKFAGERRTLHLMRKNIEANSAGCYYYISKTGYSLEEKISTVFGAGKGKIFGDLSIVNLQPWSLATDQTSTEKKDSEDGTSGAEDAAIDIGGDRLPRLFWRDVLNFSKKNK